jgi:hypothetical protein
MAGPSATYTAHVSIPSRTIRLSAAFALSLAVAGAGVVAVIASAASSSRTAPNGLAYSTASPHAVQRQPPANSCHADGSALFSMPDPHCTPGALNPSVTQSTIGSTICKGGWTSTVRPPESITEPEKLASMKAYGDTGSPSPYEYDHQVPLELGGAVNDPRNLWPEPDYPMHSGFYANPKDHLERALNRLVCAGRMPLSQAQKLIAAEWVSAFHRYG